MEPKIEHPARPQPVTAQPSFLAMPPNTRMQNPFGREPSMAICLSCHAQQVSTVNYKASSKTHLIAAILAVTTCCCWIPYCFKSCKSAEHVCSNCGSYLGSNNN